MSRFPLLPRKNNTSKSDYGHALIIAGSRDMAGAPLMASLAALRSGAGLVTLAVPRGLQAFLSKKAAPELMVLGFPATKELSFAASAVKDVRAFLKKRKISCVALGPGVSLHPQTQNFVRALVKELPVPLVLDADGLNSLKGRSEILLKRKAPLVMTPHAGEFERIFSQALPESLARKKSLAQKLSRRYRAVLVLKGHRTLVVEGKKVYVNKTGNPGMAKGGSGDVLTGILTAFIAQGLAPFEAARWAVYFHGRAGDLAVRAKGELGLLATDIIEYLPAAFKAG